MMTVSYLSLSFSPSWTQLEMYWLLHHSQSSDGKVIQRGAVGAAPAAVSLLNHCELLQLQSSNKVPFTQPLHPEMNHTWITLQLPSFHRISSWKLFLRGSDGKQTVFHCCFLSQHSTLSSRVRSPEKTSSHSLHSLPRSRYSSIRFFL